MNSSRPSSPLSRLVHDTTGDIPTDLLFRCDPAPTLGSPSSGGTGSSTVPHGQPQPPSAPFSTLDPFTATDITPNIFGASSSTTSSPVTPATSDPLGPRAQESYSSSPLNHHNPTASESPCSDTGAPDPPDVYLYETPSSKYRQDHPNAQELRFSLRDLPSSRTKGTQFNPFSKQHEVQVGRSVLLCPEDPLPFPSNSKDLYSVTIWVEHLHPSWSRFPIINCNLSGHLNPDHQDHVLYVRAETVSKSYSTPFGHPTWVLSLSSSQLQQMALSLCCHSSEVQNHGNKHSARSWILQLKLEGPCGVFFSSVNFQSMANLKPLNRLRKSKPFASPPLTESKRRTLNELSSLLSTLPLPYLQSLLPTYQQLCSLLNSQKQISHPTALAHDSKLKPTSKRVKRSRNGPQP